MNVTFRSIALGLLLIPLNAFWLALSEIVWYSGEPTSISLFYNVVFILFLLVLVNLVLSKIRPDIALTPQELLVVYTMLAISSALAGHDMIQILVPTLSHLHRFQPIEHRYDDVMPYVPDWLVVQDPDALQSAYLGQESIFDLRNLAPWVVPILYWYGFIIALCAVMWGLNLLLRKQWVENEKLSYPVLQVPFALAVETRSILRSRFFWTGFAIAAAIDLINGINVLFPLMPKIPIVHILNIQELFPERPWRDMGPAWVSFYPFAIGMCFFMPTDLAFSCWFFFIFWKLQRVFASHIGIQGMIGFPFVEEQTAGGYYAIALIGLWISRRHIAQVVRMALGKATLDSSKEDIIEARTALLLTIFGLGFLYWFCIRAGMSVWIVSLFFLMYFMISLAVTRMRAELGPPCHDLHAIGPDRQMTRFFGAAWLRQHYPTDLAMFGFLNFFNRAYRSHPMPHGLEAYRVAERLKMSNWRYTWAMGLAILTGTGWAFFALLWAFNKYGASAEIIGPGEWFGRETWDNIYVQFTAPPAYQRANLIAVLIGILTSLGLAVLRMNLAWWPFHPVGYATSGSWSMEQLWLCVFLAWAIKVILLKYGGTRAYRPAAPFFIGLIMGDFCIGSVWNLYGIIMETQVYHFWPY